MSFLGDGGTIFRAPLFRILVSVKYLPVDVLYFVDYQGHLADGVGEGGTFICTKFSDHISKLDPNKTIIYVSMFDKFLNIKIGGELLKIHHLNLTVMRAVKHTVSLF